MREFLHESVRLCKAADPLHFFITGIFISPADVVINRTCKQDVFLKHHGYLISERLQIVITYINASDFDASSRRVIETRDQLNQCGFCASRSADDSDRLARLDMKIYFFQ